MLKKACIKLIWYFRKPYLQNIYFFINWLSLYLMNYSGWWGYNDSWEKYVLKYIKKQNTWKNITIFDVGANIWWYTVMCNNVFGRDCIIHSFEPSKKTFQELEKNTKIIPNITRNEKMQHKKLYYDQECSWISSLYKRDLNYIWINMDKSESILINTLDTYIEKQKIEKITLLKLDIEWYEIQALLWWEKALKDKKIQNIQFEFWWTGIDSRIYFKDFWNMLNTNYNIYRILPKWLHKITKYSERLEIFSCANFLCVLK